MTFSSNLLFGMADNRRPNSLASRFRRQRFELFAAMLEESGDPITILDLGGTQDFWRQHLPLLKRSAQVTVVNLEPTEPSVLPSVSCIRLDARNLSTFADNAFDVCFSNSLIEHIGPLKDQRALAGEIRRVARGYFVQTPNAHFPIEPHFLVPGWHITPVALRTFLLQRWSFGWMPRIKDPKAARLAVESIRLLSPSEMLGLFPEATLVHERLGPFSKSLIAVRKIRR